MSRAPGCRCTRCGAGHGVAAGPIEASGASGAVTGRLIPSVCPCASVADTDTVYKPGRQYDWRMNGEK